jgi:hypothetical protein
MTKIIEDLATLTTISQNALVNLNEKTHACICHSVCESMLEGNPLTEIDLGIGILYIKCEEDQIKYKFIPSKKLEENVTSTVKNKVSPLVFEVETSLKDRIESTYKNLL